MIIPTFVCIPYYLPLVVSMFSFGATPLTGGEILERAFAEREALQSGCVQVNQIWELPTRPIERTETTYFNQKCYRVDIHHHSEYVKIFEIRDLQIPEIFAMLIWDGNHVLRFSANLSNKDWSLRSANRTEYPFYNVRSLGIPLVRHPQTDFRAAYRDVAVNVISRDTPLLIVEFSPRRSSKVSNATATFTIDTSQGWTIVAYTIEEDSEGFHWTLKGESIPACFDGKWFPAWHRHEQYRDGVLDWAREYHVISAEFNKPLDDDTFTWKATDIPLGRTIVSHVLGYPNLRWNGDKAVSWHPGPLKPEQDPAPPKNTLKRKEAD